MSTQPETKEVQGYFGPKQITREDFIKQWVDHYRDLIHLAVTDDDYKEHIQGREKVAKLAGAKWDSMK